MRVLLSSKQLVVVAATVVLAAVGIFGALIGQWWIAGIAAFLLFLIVGAVVADVHRKVGTTMAQIRAEGDAQRRAVESMEANSYEEIVKRLDSMERSRQATVSELASLRSQLLTRFDLLNKDFQANSRKLVAAAQSLTEAVESMDGTSSQMREAVSRETSRLSRALDRASTGMDAILDEVEEVLSARLADLSKEDRAHVERLHTELLSEVDAALQIHGRLRIDGPTPLMGGWAMTPAGMKQLMDLATEPEVSLIVECGSGTSTVLMALALQREGRSDTRIVSLEHLSEYAEVTSSQLARLGLSELAEVRLAPLEPIDLDGIEYQWYEGAAFEDLAHIDVLVVDGPPRATGPMPRYPAYPLLRDSLSPSAVVVLDDSRRAEERSTVARWLEDGGLESRPNQPIGQHVFEYRSD